MFDARFLANPYPTYQALRALGRIHWNEGFLGGAWLLTRHADIAAILRDPRFSAARSHRMTAQFPVEQRAEFAEFDRIFAKWMLFLDASEHTALRRLMNKGFKPSMLERMRPRIERVVDALLTRVEEQGSMDFMNDFAHPLPAIVIADLLGVDPDRWDDFIAWSDDIATFMGNPQSTLAMARRAKASLVALTEYFRAVLPERRRNRGDDLVSLLVRMEEEDQVIDAEDLLAQCSMLLFGGHETTRNLLGNGLLALLRHPDQWARLKHDRSLMQDALKELLRYDSPVQYTARVATEDLTLCSQEIKKNYAVILLIGSANRDPNQFSDPDTLDITRRQGPHLSFGFGPHVCIGAALSYLEAEIAFNALLDRMTDLRLADDTPQWSPNMAFRGLSALPLAFAPAGDARPRWQKSAASVAA